MQPTPLPSAPCVPSARPAPRRGLQFRHATWRGEDNRPLLCEVTAVRHDDVYYHPIYDGRRSKRGGMVCPLVDFPARVGEYVTPHTTS